MEKKISDLVNSLAGCQAACEFCFSACLKEKEVQMMAGCIKLDKECSQICGLAISQVASGGNFSAEILKLCAMVCEACAKECGKHRDAHCQECAKACSECSEMCRSYK